MSATAVLAVLIFVSIIGWEVYGVISAKAKDLTVSAADTALKGGPNSVSRKLLEFANAQQGTASANAAISQIGPAVVGELASNYFAMQERGMYTQEAGEALGQQMAPTITPHVVYNAYTTADIQTDPDTSHTRMLAYRADLQKSLAPLLKNEEPEINIYGKYAVTQDPRYLDQLKTVSQNYKDAASATAKVVVPQDALNYQLGILNAMQEFATTIDVMIENADDPIASAALLQSYNTAEQHMFGSYSALAAYYRNKKS